MKPCDKLDCVSDQPASWHPGFRIYADRELGQPANSVTGLNICDSCKATMTLDDILSDEGWEAICTAFALAGKAPPVRRNTQLIFTPILGSDDLLN